MKRAVWMSVAFLALASRAFAAPAEEAYLRGLVHERFGKPEDALAFYREAAKLDPGSRFLQQTLATLLLRLNRSDESLSAARRALALAGPDPSARVLVGRVHLGRGDRAAAIRAFDEALAVAPGDDEALLYAAYARAAADPRGAIRFLERYLKEHPDAVEPLVRIAELLEDLKDPAAEATWKKAAERSPSNPVIQFALGRLAESRGDREAARAAYEAARFLDPQDPAVLLALGELYYRMGRAEPAREAFDQAARLSPGGAAARFGLAMLAEDRRDWEEAIRQMRAAAPGSDEPGIPLRLAFYQSMAGRPRDALKTLRALRRRDPKNVDVLVYIGLAHEDLDHPRRALKWFRRALALDDKRADAHFHAAVNWDELGRFKLAEPHLLKAVELDPKSGAALNHLGYVWTERGERLTEALSLIRRAVVLEPDNAAFLDSLGWCLFKLGRATEAQGVLAQIVHPAADGTVWLHYGDVLNVLGRAEEAKRAWQEGFLLEPGNKVLRERLGGRGQAVRVDKLSAPRAVLKRVEGNFRPLRGLAGTVELRVSGKLLSMSSEGVFYYARPHRFRLEVLGAFLAPEALVVRNAEGLHAVAAGGPAPDFPQGDAWFGLIGDALSGELARRFDSPAVRVEQRDSTLTYRASFGELRIDGKTKVLTRASAGGFTVFFEDYAEVEGVQVPGVLRVEVPLEKVSFSISFRKVRVNPAMPDDLFRTPGRP